VGGLRESRLDLAAPEVEVVADVRVPHAGEAPQVGERPRRTQLVVHERAARRRPVHVEDRLPLVVLRPDPVRGLARRLARLGHDRCDRFAREHDPVPGEQGLVAERRADVRAVAEPRGHLGGGDHVDDARDFSRLVGVDREEGRVRVQRAGDGDREHARPAEVRGV
jgi:hypothetical protein